MPKRIQRTIEEIADAEDARADEWDEMGIGGDESDFLRMQATERRRLAAIIKSEEEAEEQELRRIRAASLARKKKKDLEKA